jgi:rhodanese-related sulfurtransferase
MEALMAKEISRSGLAEALISRTPPVVLEALPRKYFDSGHIPTAHALPLEGLEQTAAALVPDRDKAIVVYCSGTSCQNSHQAAERLAGLGYRNVAVFPGGKEEWWQAGLRLEI